MYAQELGSFQTEYSSGVKFRQGTEEYDIIIKYDLPRKKKMNQKQ